MQRSQQLAAVFLLGAFLVGGTLGFTVDRVVGDRLVGFRVAERDSTTSMLDEFSAELDLTTAQRAAVDSILDERHRIMDSLMAPVRPQLRAARDSARHAIARRLTPAQQSKFRAYLDRQTPH